MGNHLEYLDTAYRTLDYFTDQLTAPDPGGNPGGDVVEVNPDAVDDRVDDEMVGSIGGFVVVMLALYGLWTRAPRVLLVAVVLLAVVLAGATE